MHSQPQPSLQEVVRNTIKTKHPKTAAESAELVSADQSVNEDEIITALKEINIGLPFHTHDFRVVLGNDHTCRLDNPRSLQLANPYHDYYDSRITYNVT